nr:alpha/beta hydrolase [uncultured Rhodoferax sp.]
MNKAPHTPEGIEALPDGRSLSYCHYGHPEGVPIFQFHGTPGSRIFGLDSEQISDAGLRVVTPERPGYGRSSPNPNALVVADWVRDIQVLADRLQIDRFHVLGVSGGGPFALACAGLLPHRVVTATVVASPAPIDFASFWTGLSLLNRTLFLVSRNAPALLPALCAGLALIKKDRGEARTHEGEAFRQGGIGLEADLRALARNWGFPLGSIRVPVFLWHGERDCMASPTAAKRLAEAIPFCEPYFVPEAGHFIGRDPAIAQRMLNRILSVPLVN